MRRSISQQLEEWKSSRNRRPLLLDGARQVGKTWLLKDFGARSFRNVAYVSLDRSRVLRESFALDCDVRRILKDIELTTHERIVAGETLVVIDEIQSVPAAITSLKYFCEDVPDIHVAAAGSLLGLSVNYGSGFPVGKTETVRVYPMTFGEFLEAVGENGLKEALLAREWPVLGRFHEVLARRLRQYYFVGGMPAAVAAFAEGEDFFGARHEQVRILADYRRDFAKHAPKGNTLANIRLVWDSIPRQLARENKKFVFGAVREGGRGRDFESAIEWLKDAGLIYQVRAVSKPGIPLEAYATDAFKVFSNDVGLLAAQSGLDGATLVDGNRVFMEFKGALTEQYVQQELRAARGGDPFYWTGKGGTSEVDFVIPSHGNVIPVEVKAEENLKAKSLKVYAEKYGPAMSVKTSMSEYRRHENILNLPLYAISLLDDEMA